MVSDAQLAVVASFLERLMSDRERAEIATLEEYQRRYPGYEDAIAAEFGRVVDHAGRLPSGTAGDGSAAPGAASDAQPVRGSAAERYLEPQELARGGMGIIYRAWDPSLRRAIAIKVLAGDHSSDTPGSGSAIIERFLEEAEVTAQLEHPGIVPVHELGVGADGQVYFTMSLVRGQNFKEIIDLVHAGRDGWTLTRGLGVLQRVCEAVAFAHSKNVIHRDLKPANIMVGHFGQTYVMDWGLARVGEYRAKATSDSGPFGEAASGRIRSSRRDAASSDPISPLATMEGDVVGTPAYMAPEQARGQLDAVGARSDVYSIGAILYHLISGRMPYADIGSDTWQAILESALAGPPTALRGRARGQAVPEELLAICESAMARRPEDRYPDVRALGDDLRAFLENRVVRAHATGAIAELRKWVRRNRLAAAAAAVAILSLTTGLLTSLLLKREADANAVRAEASYRGALDAVERMLTRVAGSTLKNLPGADPIRKELLGDAAELYARFVAEHGHRPAARERVADTFGQLGIIYGELGDAEQAERHWQSAATAYQTLLEEQPDSVHAAQGLAWAWQQLSLIATNAGRKDEAERILLRAGEHLDRALQRHPDDLTLKWRRAGIDEGLGFLYGSFDRQPEALASHRRAFDEMSAVVTHPERTTEIQKSFGNLAKNYCLLLMRVGEIDDAEQVAARACTMFEELLAADPEDRDIRYDLAMALINRGVVHDAKQQPDDHLATVDRALELYRGLVRDFPLEPGHSSQLGAALHNRAMLVQRQGHVEEALALTDEAIRAQRRALTIAPGHRGYTQRLRNNLASRLFILKVLGRYRQVIADVERLVELADDAYWYWRHAGGMLFMAAGLAQEDQSVPAEERTRLCDAAMAEGAGYVRKAMALGFHEPGWFDDAELAAVREHPALLALRAEAEVLEAAAEAEASARSR